MARRRARFPAGLVREIHADPDEPTPYHVLADHLMAAGDRHGELIAVHAALRERPGDPALVRRERSVMKKLEPLGVLAPHASHVAWFMGFVTSLQLDASDDRSLAAMLRTLFELPVARFLRELVLGRPDRAQVTTYEACIAALEDAPPTLRSLALGAELAIADVVLGSIAGLGRTRPDLVRLRLRGADAGTFDLANLELPELRDLAIETTWASHSGELVQSLVAGKLGKLARLAIDFGQVQLGIDLQPILDGAFPELVDLSLRSVHNGGEVVFRLVESRLAQTIERLSLVRCNVRDHSIHELARRPLRRLAALALDENFLTHAGQELARTLCPDVDLGVQHPG